MDFRRHAYRMWGDTTVLGNMQSTWWLCFLLILTQIFEVCSGITCWHCIADDCDTNPESNHRAERRQCLDGHICQKVVFEMKSDVDDSKYKSTVRSCSEDCIPQDDYINCTMDLYTTMGCVKRACCDDDDLCNSSPAIITYHHGSISAIIFDLSETFVMWCIASFVMINFLVSSW